MAMKKKELQKALKKMGIEFPEDAKVSELKEMYDSALKQSKSKDEPDKDKDKEEAVEVVVEQRSKQASLVECMRQAKGQKPFSGSELGK